MKKIISILLIAVMLIAGMFVLTGCGNTESGSSSGGGKTATFSGNYVFNPPEDNYYVETEGSITAKVGDQYTYYEKGDDEYKIVMHINHDTQKIYTIYEGEWYIDSNYSYEEYKDDGGEGVYPLSAMEDYFMKYFRAFGFEDEKLSEYYVGIEKVAGVDCWVFDSKGLNAIYMKFWVDPSNGVTLKYEDYEDGESDIYEVQKYDINYKKMADDLIPSDYDNIDTL